MGIIHGEWIHFAFRGKAYHSIIRGAVNTPDLNNSKRRGGWAVSLYVQLASANAYRQSDDRQTSLRLSV